MTRLPLLLLAFATLLAGPADAQQRFRLDALIFTVPGGWKQVADVALEGNTVVEYIPSDQERPHWWNKLRVTSSVNKAEADAAKAANFIAASIKRDCAEFEGQAIVPRGTKQADKLQILVRCIGPKPSRYPPDINTKPYEASLITILTRGDRIYLLEVGWRNGWPRPPVDEEQKLEEARRLADLANFG